MPVKSADRTVDVLELLAGRAAPWTLGEIQRSLGVPKSSLHGLLHTLVDRGWLVASGRGYAIGIKALRVGAAYLDADPVVAAAGPVLATLRGRLDETVHLARLDGAHIVYLASRESGHHLRTSSRIGRRLPAHATALGKVLLAARSDVEVAALLPRPLTALTPNTVTSRAALWVELREIRRRGFAAEFGQNTAGLGCFAVALPGRPAATDAISCSVPLVRLTEQRQNQIVAALVEAADELGHRPFEEVS